MSWTSRPASRQARVYCGPAHGVSWTVAEAVEPPAIVEFVTSSGTQRYRLLRLRVTGQPARDLSGRLSYVPARDAGGRDMQALVGGSAEGSSS